MLSEQEINLVKTLDRAASRGPWVTYDFNGEFFLVEPNEREPSSFFDKEAYDSAESNAMFAAMARELLPKAVEEVLALRDKVAARDLQLKEMMCNPHHY